MGIKCIKVQLAHSISNAWEKLGEMRKQLWRWGDRPWE